MPAERPRSVAVVAVHGVADQKPNETARAIADLLARVDGEGGSYRTFEETDIRLPVHEVKITSLATHAPDPSAASDSRVVPQARPSLFALRQSLPIEREAEGAHVAAEGVERLAHTFMARQLAAYRPDTKDAVFETLRLDSVRNSRPRRVHVFEAYWADLSRLESGILSAVLELYQLMFYVCSLGRKTIQFARTANPSRWWGAFAWAHAIVEWPLTLGVPILNLMALALAAVLFTIKIPDDGWSVRLSGIAGMAIAAALGGGLLTYVGRMRFRGSVWPVAGIVCVVLAAGGAALGYLVFGGARSYRPLGFIGFVLSSVPFLWLMAAYQRRRRGAFLLGCIAVFAVGAMLGYELWTIPGSGPELHRLVGADLRTMERVLLALQVCWLILMSGIVLTAITGALAVRFGTSPGRRQASARAAWTVNLSTTGPALIVIILNLAFWSAIHGAGTRIVTELKRPEASATSGGAVRTQPATCRDGSTICYEPVLLDGHGGPVMAGEAIGQLLDRSVQPLLLIFPVAAIVLLVSAWSLLPAIAGEFPRLVASGIGASAWLGDALSAGFRAMRVSGYLLLALFFILAVAGTVALVRHAPPDLPLQMSTTVAGLLGAAVTLAVTASKGPFRFLALGFRSALDVALDVTNWLRTHPLDRNPRARICARFTSLLRHICQWVDPVDGSGYDALVIIAHSQGTVITTDLLRFLRGERDPALERFYDGSVPVYLFTMGCPLRQLYGLRFPDLYGWAWHVSGAWPGQHPEPAALGVQTWTNAYRSGDYVGRYLWFPDTGDERWGPVQESQRDRSEVCIGAGAHTHYWDETAPAIRRMLDQIVANA